MPARKSKAEEIIEGVSNKAYEVTGGKIGKKKDAPSPAKIAEINRNSGMEIMSILKSIRVSHGAYKGGEGYIAPDKLQEKISDAVACIQNANTIQDDVSGIDKVLKYAALALQSGVRDGKPEKVKWAKNAVCAGAIYWRFDVPEDHAGDREENLAARTKYMGYYKSIIENAEIVDDKRDSAKGLTDDLNIALANYSELRQKVLEMANTPEGQKLMGEISLNVSTPNNLSSAAREYRKQLKAAAIEAHAMKTINGELYKVEVELTSAQQLMRDYRARLKDKPTAYNKEIMADYALMLNDMVNDIARALAEAAETERLARDFESRLDAVLNGQDAQMLAKTLEQTQTELFSVAEEDKDYFGAGAKILEKYRNKEAEKARVKAEAEERQLELEAEAEEEAAREAERQRKIQEETVRNELINENPNMNIVG